MASSEEIAQLIRETVRAVMEGMQGTGVPTATGGGHNRRILESKGVSRVDAFSGKETQWKEWSFQFRVAIKAMGSRVAIMMQKAELEEEGYDVDALELEYSNMDVTKVAGELYDLLCLCVKGDPLILVQGVVSMNGFQAWSRLYRRFNPVTPARALQAMIAVMVPQRVKDVRDLPNEIKNGRASY